MSDGQLPLLPEPARRAPRPATPVAAELPVARVALMVAPPHLDHVFDYAVPAALDDAVQPGVRVRVRLSGRLVDGFVLDRVSTSERALAPLRSVHGPPVLTPAVARVAQAVAERYAGTLADVLRFAVPARHARAERAVGQRGTAGAAPPAGGEPAVAGNGPADAAWAPYEGGTDLLASVGGDPPVRAAWLAGPGEPIAQRVAELVAATARRGRGAIVVVPDAADVDRHQAALAAAGLAPVRLSADLGPEARYRAFLTARRDPGAVVVGTRAAVFAPVALLGLVVVVDDADESLAEPQAPGWHAREVAALRCSAEPASLVLAGPSLSLEASRMAQSGWMRLVRLPRPVLRARMPRVLATGDVADRDPVTAHDRIPSVVLSVLREATAEGGRALVSVPRAGYLPALACQSCREQARCPTCARPLVALGQQRQPACRVHGTLAAWVCPFCGGAAVRAVAVGAVRTAEEFGRALPGVPVVLSSGEHPVRSLGSAHGLVVATPGTEPDPGPQGYAALVVMDAVATLSRPGLRVAEEALRRWLAAAVLVRPAQAGGQVLVVGDPDVREVQAIVRWDPAGYAARELAERRELGLPPAVRVARLTGPALATAELARSVGAGVGSERARVVGPLPGSDEDHVTWLVSVTLADGPALSGALRREQALRSARRDPVVTSRMDPASLGPAAPP